MTTRTISDRSFNSVQLSQAEAADLARLTAAAYARLMDYYRNEYKVTPAEADAMALTPRTLDGVPSHEIRWLSLCALLERDPAAATAIWQRIADDAAGYVEGGYAVADALKYETPWERAQFLAIRRALYEEWQPSAVEQLLLDIIAHAHMSYLYWAAQVQDRGTADSAESAAHMMDRFNRLQIRSLRSLRDLRRSGVVVVAQAGSQVNVGQQQVNAARMEVEGR